MRHCAEGAPCADDPDAKPDGGPKAGDPKAGDPTRAFNAQSKDPTLIVVVDDDALARERLEATIRIGGYATRGFATAEQFFEWPPWTRVRYVFAALTLPGIGGVALHARAAKLGHPIAVVLIAKPDDTAPATVVELAAQGMALLREPLAEDREDVFVAIEVAAGYRDPD